VKEFFTGCNDIASPEIVLQGVKSCFRGCNIIAGVSCDERRVINTPAMILQGWAE
jgi:hypothetical protein